MYEEQEDIREANQLDAFMSTWADTDHSKHPVTAVVLKVFVWTRIKGGTGSVCHHWNNEETNPRVLSVLSLV